jgi:hypothetical protein
MDKMHRAQILLEPRQHKKLAELAQKEGISISQIVRAAVARWLEERQDDEILRQRLADLEQVAGHRQAILARRNGKPLEIDLTGIIEQMREERDDELLASSGHRR